MRIVACKGLAMKKSDQPALRRRAFLASAAQAGKALATANILRAWPGVLAGGTFWPAAALGQTAAELVQPQEIRSRNGVLDAALTAAPAHVQLGSFSFEGMLYNGSYLPPLLRARTGDVLRIAFSNGLPRDPSNLHFHGMSVSPKGKSDNIFIHVHPGEEFHYEVKIPAHGRQRPGLF